MTREELYIKGCKYAIGEQIRKGSSSYLVSAPDGRQKIDWLDTMDYLNELEPCEDCISREQAKAEIRKAFPSLPDRVDINSILNELPSVQPKTKTGHWMDAGNRGCADVDSDNIILYQEMCNRCKCLSYFRKSSGLLIGAKYCPNCGAKMESEE